MLKVIPRNIKRIFVFEICLGLIAFFLGLIFSCEYIYSFCIGVVISIISNLLLLGMVYLLVYMNYKTYISYIRYLISYALYAVTLYFVHALYKDIYTVIICALGLCSFKISCYIIYILKKYGKKVHKF